MKGTPMAGKRKKPTDIIPPVEDLRRRIADHERLASEYRVLLEVAERLEVIEEQSERNSREACPA
jgi:hypothetical protein